MLNERTQILKEIKQAVLEVDPGAEVVLFGSRARGDYHEESDWDILILVDKDEKDVEFKKNVRNALYELELKEDTIITGIVVNKKYWRERLNESPLYWEVEKDGVLF